ncbi:hypothetical protein K469DRAFT_765657 [Zopfia rhizophila CBS 207.26]|uniref:Uncharacterized protein n=1 Tax=Zopfia rhizophila CBS 207.26 TaxID=1314779 RepID=A0A6A6E9V2_9PEZI|nr:hypothetical protein K469DRAFT_765657 [Zopfia rhizophila CBS 207.26]
MCHKRVRIKEHDWVGRNPRTPGSRDATTPLQLKGKEVHHRETTRLPPALEELHYLTSYTNLHQVMSSIPNSNLYYHSDKSSPNSPGLQPIRVKATPSPSPPPSTSQNAEPPKRRTRKRERRTRPSQGDGVLMRFMDPDHPDIAERAGQSPLNSASEYETSEAEDEELCEHSFSHNRKGSKRHKASIPSPKSTVIEESNGHSAPRLSPSSSSSAIRSTCGGVSQDSAKSV